MPALYRPQTILTVNDSDDYTIHVTVYLNPNEKLVKTDGDPQVSGGAYRLRYKVVTGTSPSYPYNEQPFFHYEGIVSMDIYTTVTKDDMIYSKRDSTDRAEPAAG